MQDISFVNPQINNIAEQEISIQVSLNGFSFIIRSYLDKKCLYFKHICFKHVMLTDELFRKIEHILETTSYIDKSFERANITYISQQSTLVPEEFFNPSQIKTYFEFNQNLGELDEIHYTHIPEISAYNVFSFPNYLSNILHKIGKTSKFRHQSTALIKVGNQLHQKSPEGICIVLGFNKAFFDMVVFEEGNLLISNSYPYANTMDILYFYLYTLKQLKIDSEKSKTYLLGEMISDRKFIDEISDQISSLTLPEIKQPGMCQNMGNKEIVQFYSLFLD